MDALHDRVGENIGANGLRAPMRRVVFEPTRGYIGGVTFRDPILEVVVGARRR